jgi:hypothetical protein
MHNLVSLVSGWLVGNERRHEFTHQMYPWAALRLQNQTLMLPSVFQYAAQDSFRSAITSVNRVLPANSAPLDLFSFAVIVRKTRFLALAASNAPLVRLGQPHLR